MIDSASEMKAAQRYRLGLMKRALRWKTKDQALYHSNSDRPETKIPCMALRLTTCQMN